MAALSKIDVVRLAPTYLQDLAGAASETVFLAVINNDEVVYVYKEEGPRPIRMVSQVGSRRPLHSTALGKAYISALPFEAQRSLIERLDLRRFMPNTITNPAAFDEEIALTRERGYAVDNVEVEEGVACVGAPVFDFRGLPVASISVAGPADRVFPRAEQLGPVVAKTALEISRRLGYLESARKGV
jgi:DNA-binding IclR family transcriptional regulator